MSGEELYPKDNAEYANKDYWDWRYRKDVGEYDWFQGSYDKCKEIVLSLVSRNDRLLQVGCGNSKLSADIYDALEGEVDIVNIDFSDVVIENMQKQNEGKKMSWVVMDALELTFEPASFDVVIDKGTMDAIMCEQGDVWELPDDIADRCAKEMKGISRVLKPGGVFIYITFGQPHFRKPVLVKDEYQWDLEVKTVGDGFHYFIYILRKKN